jgi:hypothetical protein
VVLKRIVAEETCFVMRCLAEGVLRQIAHTLIFITSPFITKMKKSRSAIFERKFKEMFPWATSNLADPDCNHGMAMLG